MTHLEQQDLVKRLRIKADMITQGEKITWGSDSALMHEAANALEATRQAAIEECVQKIENYFAGLIVIPDPQATKANLITTLKADK
jgi:hypothetical protein